MTDKNMELRFDWLTFRIRGDWFVDDVIRDLLYDFPEQYILQKGRYGYKTMKFHHFVSVMYDGYDPAMGICVDISGQGMSYLYEQGFSFIRLFQQLSMCDAAITRLDVALDCFDHELDLSLIEDCVLRRAYTSKWKKVKIIHSYDSAGVGTDIQFGVRSSLSMLRIYDKKVEQKRDDMDYWVRLEFQLRDEIASSFADTCVDFYCESIGVSRDDYTSDDFDLSFHFEDLLFPYFRGFLSYYLRFVNPIYDKSHIAHCPTLDWWDEFLDSICRKSIFLRQAKSDDYCIDKLLYNVSVRFSQSYAAFVKLFGEDRLLDILSNVEVSNPHYLDLLSRFSGCSRLQSDAFLDRYFYAEGGVY